MLMLLVSVRVRLYWRGMQRAVVRHPGHVDVKFPCLWIFDGIAAPGRELWGHSVPLWKSDWLEVHRRALWATPWLVTCAYTTLLGPVQ